MIEASKTALKTNIKTAENFDSLIVNDHGIEVRTSSYSYQLIFYTPEIIRVHQHGEITDTNPYSVIREPNKVNFSVEENDDSIVVISENVDVVIGKSPIRFTFLTKDGKVINQDDEGFGIQAQGEHKTVYKKLQDGERFVGLGEKTGPLDRRGRGYENWNTDHFAYEIDADPLYSSIPFYIGIHGELSYGIFLDNSYKSHFNFGASNNRFSSFSVDSGDMNYYFFAGSVQEIIESYTWLTGRMKLPPLWSIGYQQCRYSYYPDTEVIDVAKKFRDKDIPADVMVLDIHYMDQYKIFSWDKKRFPYPGQMVELLEEMGFEVVVICDPGIKIEKGYEPHETGLKEDIYLKYPDNTNYEGEVWPGWCNFPDFTNQKTREWWKEMMKSYTDIGLKGFWNDMNEIATWGQMLPDNITFDFEGEGATTRKGRNIYGLQMSRSSYEGARENLKGKRPFILTRAAFAGIQRYSALWTGDNVANDEHMFLGVRLVNSLGLSGVAFSGYDVGGFAGNGQSHLFARWIQVGAFSPFFRGHSVINSHDSEPWSYGEEVEEISKNYIRLRYKLLPYIYNAFLVACERGLPVARSLCINYSTNEQVYSETYENQYLFGDSILVAPIGSAESFSKIYFPPGEWYEFFTDEKVKGDQEVIREYGIEHLPLFVKASSIIPLYAEAAYNSKGTGKELELHVYNGKDTYSFEYYEDDGVSHDHENEMYHRRMVTFDPSKKELKIDRPSGHYNSKMEVLRLVFHGFESDSFANATFANELANDQYSFVNPISNFDPVRNDVRKDLKIEQVQLMETKYSNDEMVFTW